MDELEDLVSFNVLLSQAQALSATQCEFIETIQRKYVALKEEKFQLKKDKQAILDERYELEKDQREWNAMANKLDRTNIMSPIKLNVGGTTFSTTLATLTSTFTKGSYFHGLFSGRRITEVGESEEIFIDRDPTVFRFILNFLRGDTPDISLLSASDRKDLATEAKFYGLTGLLDCLKTDPSVKIPNNEILADSQCVAPVNVNAQLSIEPCTVPSQNIQNELAVTLSHISSTSSSTCSLPTQGSITNPMLIYKYNNSFMPGPNYILDASGKQARNTDTTYTGCTVLGPFPKHNKLTTVRIVRTSRSCIAVGLTDRNADQSLNNLQNGVYFYCRNHRFYSNHHENPRKSLGYDREPLPEGTTIGVKLDGRRVIFFLNGRAYGPALKVPSDNYRLAVLMQSENDVVELL